MAQPINPTIRFALVGDTIYADAAPGTVVGTFVLLNASKQPQLVLTDDAGGRFALSGSQLVRGLVPLTVGTFEVRVDGRGAGIPAGVFSINVVLPPAAPIEVPPPPVVAPGFAAGSGYGLGAGAAKVTSVGSSAGSSSAAASSNSLSGSSNSPGHAAGSGSAAAVGTSKAASVGSSVGSSSAAAASNTSSNSSLSPQYVGVNFGQGSFASSDAFTSEAVGAGTFYHDSLLKTSSADPAFAGLPNYNVIRVAELWERIQPTLSAALNSSRLSRLTAEINATTSRGGVAILNIHNYGFYSPDGVNNYLIGSTQVPASAFYDLWTRLANAFKSNPLVWFGLMNEPVNFTGGAAEWAGYAAGAKNAIRATGATNKILVPGIGYTGAWSWSANGNDTAFASFTDTNFAFEVHQYADYDYSGTHRGSLVSETIYQSTLSAVTAWARTNSRKLFLGEFNTDREIAPIGERALAVALQYMQANSDVWIGASIWHGGPLGVDDMNTVTTEANGTYPSRHDRVMRALMVQGSTVAIPANTAAGAASGTAQEGKTIAVSDGTWTHAGTADLGFEVEYKWSSSSTSGGTYVDLAGQTSNGLVLLGSHVGKYFRSSTRGKNIGGTSAWTQATGTIGPVTSGTAANLFAAGGSDLTTSDWRNGANTNLTGLSATAISGNASGGYSQTRDRDVPVESGYVYTVNFRTQTWTTSPCLIVFSNKTTGAYRYITINLSSGSTAVGSGGGTAPGSAFSNISVTTDPAGGYRVDFEWTPDFTGLMTFSGGVGVPGNGAIYLTDIWFGQAAARPAAGTNLLTNGDNLSLSPWAWNRTGAAGQAVTANTVSGDASNGAGVIVRSQGVTVPSGRTAFSFQADYSNPGTGNGYGSIGLAAPSGAYKFWTIEIATGTVSDGGGTLTGYSLAITSPSTGVKRATVTGPATTPGSYTLYVGLPNYGIGPVQIDNIQATAT